MSRSITGLLIAFLATLWAAAAMATPIGDAIAAQGGSDIHVSAADAITET